MTDKPNLRQLINKHHVTAIHVSQVSNVPLMLVHSIMNGVPKPEPMQRRVLYAFNAVARTNYAFEDVELCRSTRNSNQSAANGSQGV